LKADEEKRREAWSLALGMSEIYAPKLSSEFLGDVEKEIQGEITLADMLQSWEQRYKERG